VPLDPQMQAMRDQRERDNVPPLYTMSLADARAADLASILAGGGEPEAVHEVTGLTISGPGGELPVRLYRPGAQSPLPVLLYFFGGGWVLGTIDTADGVSRSLANAAGALVVVVGYRLAPEHPFPAAIEDCYAALRWVAGQAGEIGADPTRIAVGGDSAGGNLAAVFSQLAARDGGPAPAIQLLIYPVTDVTTRRRSRELFGEGFLLTDSEMDWFEDNYLGPARTHASDPRASPLLAGDLSGLAPAYVVTAGFDPLRDEGEAYTWALREAGTPATLRRFPGFIHGFVNGAGISRTARDALVEIAGATRGMFAWCGSR
jgi:acetyl esterase/lipase